MSRFAVLALTVLCLSCSAPPEETASLEELEAAAGTVAGPALPGDVAKLQVVDSPAVGPVVADRDQYTLYFNADDSTSPPKSTCLEPECTLVWVPLLAKGGRFEAPALDQKLLGTLTRPDGLEQVTLAGRPVYRFVDDERTGDAVGHGTDNRWFAISPKGDKASR